MPPRGLPRRPAAVTPTIATPKALDASADTLTITRAELLKLDATTRAQRARDGFMLSHSDFNALPLAARSRWACDGGRIAPDNTPAIGTAAKSFGNV